MSCLGIMKQAIPSFVFVGSLIKTQSTSNCSPIPCQNDLAKEKEKNPHYNKVGDVMLVTWLKCKGEELLTGCFHMCVGGGGGVRGVETNIIMRVGSLIVFHVLDKYDKKPIHTNHRLNSSLMHVYNIFELLE